MDDFDSNYKKVLIELSGLECEKPYFKFDLRNIEKKTGVPVKEIDEIFKTFLERGYLLGYNGITHEYFADSLIVSIKGKRAANNELIQKRINSTKINVITARVKISTIEKLYVAGILLVVVVILVYIKVWPFTKWN